MGRSADDIAEASVLRVLAAGPADAIDLLAALRPQWDGDFGGVEGALHPVLLRALRRGHVRIAGRTSRNLTRYVAAAGETAVAPHDTPFADPTPISSAVSRASLRVARSVRDPAERGRVVSDVAAHLTELEATGRTKTFGRPKSIAALVDRADRGRRSVFVVRTAGDAFKRMAVHDAPWLVGLIVAFFVVRGFFLEVFHIPSGSMQPTLQPKERVVVRKDKDVPDRFAVITFRLGEEVYVKRLVGLPGEAFAIRNGDLFADGKRLVKPAALTAQLEREIAAWDFTTHGGRPGPGSSWRRLSDLDTVRWIWDAPRLAPDGSSDPRGGAYGFHLRDARLEARASFAGPGDVELALVRKPVDGAAVGETMSFRLRVGSSGLRLTAEDGGAGTRTILHEPAWRPAGDIDLALSYVDGVLAARVGGRKVEASLEAPDQPLVFECTTIAEGRLGRVRLIADQHWSHEHQVAVPRATLAGGPLPPLESYAVQLSDTQVFVLGDNTTNSRDSRDAARGPVSTADLVGPVVFRLWPPSRLGTVR